MVERKNFIPPVLPGPVALSVNTEYELLSAAAANVCLLVCVSTRLYIATY